MVGCEGGRKGLECLKLVYGYDALERCEGASPCRRRLGDVSHCRSIARSTCSLDLRACSVIATGRPAVRCTHSHYVVQKRSMSAPQATKVSHFRKQTSHHS
jgi:hypothetical protein